MSKYTEAIRRYHEELRGSTLKEAPRKDKFLLLLKDLFPRAKDELRAYTDGAEKPVQIESSGNEIIRRGSIDAFYGDLLIEFERSMGKKAEAEGQLKAYCAGMWNSEPTRRHYVCIATDGVAWQTYAPSTRKTGQLRPEDIFLTPRESLVLTPDEATCEAFFLFINRLFFRDGNLKPTVETFTKDFGLESYLFESVQSELNEAFGLVKRESDVDVSFSEWTRYLTYTYGKLSPSEPLFCKHTYLSMLSRFIVWAALADSAGDQTSPELIGSLIDGTYFDRIGILNLAERDFFHWIGHKEIVGRLLRVWMKVLNQLRSYDFSVIDEDLLKGVYQELVDPADRHDLGEYYTPDWLCEKVVDRVVKKPKGRLPSVIDLTCGSGSFLRAAVHKVRSLIEAAPEHLKLDGVLNAILSNVHGIDIHPLAVMITKANYVLALKELLPYRKKPVRLPVYLADSLFMPQTDEIELQQRKNVIITFLGEKYALPHAFFSDQAAYDTAIVLCFAVAENLAREDGTESEEGLLAALRKSAPSLVPAEELPGVAHELFRLTRQLAAKIRENKDTIWSFILRNNLKPVFLHGCYDVIVGNPPWLSYRYIGDPDYQAQIKKLSRDEYGIAPDQAKLLTQMELATLFLVHAVHRYLKPGGVLGYVMPRSVFSADQHEKFRAKSFTADCDIEEYWDLDVRPLFNVPACVIVARHQHPQKADTYPAQFLSGKLPARDLPLAAARSSLEEKSGKLYLVRMGDRTALSPTRIRFTERPLPYKERFSQGATIVPRNFYFVVEPDAAELQSAEFFARTDPEQALEAKAPYKEVFLEGIVETQFLFRTALSKHILPFCALDLPYVLLPVIKESHGCALKTASELRALGHRRAADWFQKAEREWDRRRGAKADRQSLYARLNYHNELLKQDPEAQWVVLYNSAGTNLSSALVAARNRALPFFAEHKTYWAIARSVEEGQYLVSVLNCATLNEIVKPFQSRGLLGERDIEKKVLEIPIPEFDRKDPTHRRLAELAAVAGGKVQALAKVDALRGSLAMMRGQARKTVASELREIDGLVKKALS